MMTNTAFDARDEWLLVTLEGLLTPEQFGELRGQKVESYWEAAVRLNMCADDDILKALSERFRMKIANTQQVSQQAKELVPEQLARKYRVLPLAISDTHLDIATADPHDLDCERTLAFALGRTVRMALASPTRISERIEELYRPENVVEKILEGVSTDYDVEAISEEFEDAEMDIGGADRASDRPVIRLVDHIVAEGIQSRASDIHIEPEEAGVAVRYRIDGVLRQVMILPRAAGIPLVSRIKIMASLDIADRLRPQDGRARVAVNGSRVDLRVSTLPASQGEKVVIRILDQRATVLSLDSLGLNPDESARIKGLLDVREGVVLVTGPTGSGKTTTLYSMLRMVQARGVNIITVEDPVEYRLQGIVQVQVNEKAGLTFVAALRSILRQDPDVILVGEIRDRETANIAIQASLTGHLVLSTLHTIDAPSSIARLVDIGIEPYKIAAAIKGIIAQRLMRRLCQSCRELHTGPVPERLKRWFPDGMTTLYRGVGCPDCSMTGYRGRFSVTEVLVTSAEFERRVAAAVPVDQLVEAAHDAGMLSLWDSGIQHVRNGETSIDELLRVLEAPTEQSRPTTGVRGTTDGPAATAEPTNGATEARRGNGGLDTLAAHVLPKGAEVRTHLHAVPPSPVSNEFQLVDDVVPDGRAAAKKVLLVEDEDALRRVMKDLLEREGFICFEAADGVQALDEIDRAAPDIVVLDLNLPRLDGYGVLSHLRARAATQELPVIVLTAKGDEDSEVRVFEFGANDYLTKPFRPRALSARLHSLLARRRG
ncbi:MAG: Flp pilus assembly complex ATPase component TadA [Gemmatimonadetes bacterium]|nr:Flp pilus assembly complex ATPase component TadA [Gemmatimonadota bacterium]